MVPPLTSDIPLLYSGTCNKNAGKGAIDNDLTLAQWLYMYYINYWRMRHLSLNLRLSNHPSDFAFYLMNGQTRMHSIIMPFVFGYKLSISLLGFPSVMMCR